MKVYKQITDIFVKIVSAALMVLVAGIVGIMLYELCLRNFFNKSFRSSTELCGFLFMWMAFLGVDRAVRSGPSDHPGHAVRAGQSQGTDHLLVH